MKFRGGERREKIVEHSSNKNVEEDIPTVFKLNFYVN